MKEREPYIIPIGIASVMVVREKGPIPFSEYEDGYFNISVTTPGGVEDGVYVPASSIEISLTTEKLKKLATWILERKE